MQGIEFKCESRIASRAKLCLERMSAFPGASFPQMFNTSAELEGFYRLLNNPHFEVAEVVGTTSAFSFGKVPNDQHEIIAIHDTTKILPKVAGEEFGPTSSMNSPGFFAHVSLLSDLSPRPFVYGVGDIYFWTREVFASKENTRIESARWYQQVQSLEGRNKSLKKIIHVMDREGDSYELFGNLVCAERNFVIRLAHDRVIKKGEAREHLFAVMAAAEVVVEKEVRLAKHSSSPFLKTNKIYPPREARKTQLSLRAQKINFTKSGWLKRNHRGEDLPENLELNVVCVLEINPPTGEKPVEWFLVTSESIDSPEQVIKVVDIYRRRWIIEEFFKALKTGCQIEQRLFASLEPWYKMLSLFMNVATMILNLRVLEEREVPGPYLLTPTQKQILEQLAQKRGKALSHISDFKAEIAKLGGHIHSSGPPGWIVLARGVEKLLMLELGWSLHCNM